MKNLQNNKHDTGKPKSAYGFYIHFYSYGRCGEGNKNGLEKIK